MKPLVRKLLVCLGPQAISVVGRASRRPSGARKVSRGLVYWASVTMTVVMVAGVLLAVDPRFGGSLAPRLLSLFGHGGFRGAAFADVIWATTLANAFLVLLASATVSAKRMYSDPVLLPVVASPISTRLLVGNRLVAAGLDLASVGRITLWPLVWVVVTGPGSLDLAASGLTLGLVTIASGSVLGFQMALLVRRVTEHRGPIRVLAPLLTLVPAVLVVPLARLGPAAVTWPFAAMSIGLTALLAGATLVLGPVYRAGVYSAGATLERSVRRPTGVVGDRRGPIWATINRDLTLVASNPVTLLRLMALAALVAVYLSLETRLDGIGHLLAPGTFGLPFAYALIVWYLAISEIGVSLGQVDLALSLTVAASPCAGRTTKLAGFLSNAVWGVPTCIAAGLAVLALSRVPHDAMDTLAYSAGLAAVAAGQAALSAFLSRGGTGCSDEVRVESAGWMGMLLEQVPLSPKGLRTLGLLASHLALTVIILASGMRTLGVSTAYLVSFLLAVLPITLFAFGRRQGTLTGRRP